MFGFLQGSIWVFRLCMMQQSFYIGKSRKGKIPHTLHFSNIRIPKPPYISSLKIIRLLNFLNFLGLSEENYNLQSLWITLYQILLCWASFFHLTRAKIELPRPNKTIAEGFLCVLTHFRTSHSCQQAGRWWRGGVWSLYLAIAVHFTSCWIFQMHFRRCSELWGGDPEIFERRVKVLESFQDLRVHHPSLPPDLHPFQVMKLNEQDQMA